MGNGFCPGVEEFPGGADIFDKLPPFPGEGAEITFHLHPCQNSPDWPKKAPKRMEMGLRYSSNRISPGAGRC